MAAGSAAIFFSSRMSPAAFTMHTLTVSRDTSRPAKYSIFLSLGCHTECQDSRLGSTARLLHLCRLGLDGDVPDHSTFSKNRHGRFRESDLLRKLTLSPRDPSCAPSSGWARGRRPCQTKMSLCRAIAATLMLLCRSRAGCGHIS